MMKKIWKISNLKYIAAFLIPAIFVLMINHGLDNDSWYVLAEGREIVQNGVYYTDSLSMHEGLSVTVQNYGFAMIFYLLFTWLGAPGIYVAMLILNFVVCFLIYKICMLISERNINLSLLIMIVTDLVLALAFVVTRAQMVSFVIFLALIYVLELYVKTNKAKYLWLAPLFSVLQINLHASLWWMLIFVVVAYIVDSIGNPKIHLQGYRSKPLLAALVGMMFAGFANPYGFNMILFILRSYGDMRFHNMVVELHSFSPFRSIFEAVIYLSIVGVMFLYIFGKKENVRIRYLLMFFGFLALGLNTIKGLSQFILVMFFPLAFLYKHVKIERFVDAKIGRDALVFWGGVVSLAIFAAVCPLVVSGVSGDPGDAIVRAVDAIDNDVKKDGGEKRVYTGYAGYGDGGYVEYRGYKSYMDPRGEVFLKKNNGKEDILYEYDDFINGKVSIDYFLEKYNFDYIIPRDENDPFYNLDHDDYEIIFNNEEECIKVYKRVRS